MSRQLELIATAPMGLEAVVARELKDLGYTDTKVENGVITSYSIHYTKLYECSQIGDDHISKLIHQLVP